jgi:hypothetical protein
MVDLGFAAIAATAVLSCHIEADLRVGLFFCLLISCGPIRHPHEPDLRNSRKARQARKGRKEEQRSDRELKQLFPA